MAPLRAAKRDIRRPATARATASLAPGSMTSVRRSPVPHQRPGGEGIDCLSHVSKGYRRVGQADCSRDPHAEGQ